MTKSACDDAVSHDFLLPTHRLNYLTWGDPGSPSLVLIHGGLDNAQSWEDLAVLLGSEWHVHALDLRGHGDSDWSSTGDYLPSGYLGDVARFLKEVVGFPARIVGHSMGARLMLQLAGAMPEAVAALVAIEGLGAEEPPADSAIDANMRKWITDRAERAARSEVEQFGDWLRERVVTDRRNLSHADLDGRISRCVDDPKKRLTHQQAEAFVHSNMRRTDDGWKWKFDPLARWQASHEGVSDQLPFWSAVVAPVLHVYGADSWAYPPHPGKLDAFREARLAVVPGGGHWVQLNQPALLAAEIGRFFKEIDNTDD